MSEQRLVEVKIAAESSIERYLQLTLVSGVIRGHTHVPCHHLIN